MLDSLDISNLISANRALHTCIAAPHSKWAGVQKEQTAGPDEEQTSRVHSWTQWRRNKSFRLRACAAGICSFLGLKPAGWLRAFARFGDIFGYLSSFSLSPRQSHPQPGPCSSNTLVVGNRGVLSQQSRRSPWKREREKKKRAGNSSAAAASLTPSWRSRFMASLFNYMSLYAYTLSILHSLPQRLLLFLFIWIWMSS